MAKNGGNETNSETFSIEEFRNAPDYFIERSLAGHRVVIESAPGRVAIVLSVCSLNDVDDD